MDYIINGTIEAFKLLFSGHAETYSAIITTIKASSLSIFFSLLMGMPLGFLLGYKDFTLKKTIRAIVDTLLALPTVVVGLLVYAFISRRGPLGESEILFTIPGIVLAQVLLILPIVISLTATAIENLDKRLDDTLLTLGARGNQVILTYLYEARFALFLFFESYP